MRRLVSLLVLFGLAAFGGLSTVTAEDAPAKIRVLIITGDDVDVHPWRETTASVRDTLTAIGKFDVKVSDDLKPLDSADELKNYDVIVYNRYNRKAPLTAAAKENLLAFVKGGKGFFVQHLASASFADWPEFGKLCGRYWVMGKSGHGPRAAFDAKIADKDHPITKGLDDFNVDDELYAKLQGDGPIHVLVSADSNFSHKTEPLVFTVEYGKGRVVHNAFGHDGKALATPAVKKIVSRGVEWAATGKVSEEK